MGTAPRLLKEDFCWPTGRLLGSTYSWLTATSAEPPQAWAACATMSLWKAYLSNRKSLKPREMWKRILA